MTTYPFISPCIAADALMSDRCFPVSDDKGVGSMPGCRLSFASDASHYPLTPQPVVAPCAAAEAAGLFKGAVRQRVPLVLYSGGTSLSDDAITDGVLVDVPSGFRGLEVLDGDLRVRVQPGVTLQSVNRVLARCGLRLTLDPASEAACTVGGFIAKSSSRMMSGTADRQSACWPG